MGADYHAKAVIGIEINEADIPKKHFKVKAFDHDYPEDWEVEPTKPNRKLWKEGNFPEFDFEYAQEFTRKIELPKNIQLFKGTDGQPAVLGFGIETGSSNGGIDYEFEPISDITDIKNSLKNLLEPLGMWDETSFGLYSILYCSY